MHINLLFLSTSVITKKINTFAETSSPKNNNKCKVNTTIFHYSIQLPFLIESYSLICVCRLNKKIVLYKTMNTRPIEKVTCVAFQNLTLKFWKLQLLASLTIFTYCLNKINDRLIIWQPQNKYESNV